MDRKELSERMAQHPRAVSFAEARRVLNAYGWELARVSGSHHVFERESASLTVPFKRPNILPVYVRQILEATAADDVAEKE